MSLIINGTDITTDNEGRFSLNDLHRSAGGLNSQKPSLFYRSDSFNAVVEILNAQNRAFKPIIKKAGKYGGTWVCKELVYKYAMWVNPDFEVKVIQTFDQITETVNAPATMKALNDLSVKIENDKELASKCGELLAKYKKTKRENTEAWLNKVDQAQLTLGIADPAQ